MFLVTTWDTFFSFFWHFLEILFTRQITVNGDRVRFQSVNICARPAQLESKHDWENKILTCRSINKILWKWFSVNIKKKNTDYPFPVLLLFFSVFFKRNRKLLILLWITKFRDLASLLCFLDAFVVGYISKHKSIANNALNNLLSPCLAFIVWIASTFHDSKTTNFKSRQNG